MTAAGRLRSKVTKSLLLGSSETSKQLSFDLKEPPPRLKQLWTPDDIFNHLDEVTISAFLEDRRIERKGARVQAANLGEYLSMWANTAPDGGLILVGVENNGEITGCLSMDQKHKNTLEETYVHCEDARPRCKEVKVKNSSGNDDYIIAFRVPYHPDKLVLTSANKAFFRQGSTKCEMSDDVKREYRIIKGEIHHELETVALDFPQDFDPDQVAKFCTEYSKAKQIQRQRSPEDILELAKLGRKTKVGFVPNLAGCLLLAKDPRSIIPGSYIRIIRYEGSSQENWRTTNSVFSEIIDGPIPVMLDLARQRISSQIRFFQRLTSSGRLERKPEYPEPAWLEVLVNAVSHRSYNLRTQPIFVKLFDDRMVVESPGSFVPPVTAETVYDLHAPRNPNLMEAMWYLGFTFMAAEGTNRIREEMVKAQLPEPKFYQGEAHNYRVTVVLENDIKSKQNVELEFAGLEESLYSSLSREERLIVHHLAVNKGITVSQAAAIIERSEPTASKTLNALVQKNILNPFVPGRSEHVRPKTFSLKKPN